MNAGKGVLRIDGQVEWICWFDAPGDQWLAVCPALNLNAFGATCEDRVECLQAVTRMLWADLLEEGDFDQSLRERGWSAPDMQGYPKDKPASAVGRHVDLPHTMKKGVLEEIHA